MPLICETSVRAGGYAVRREFVPGARSAVSVRAACVRLSLLSPHRVCREIGPSSQTTVPIIFRAKRVLLSQLPGEVLWYHELDTGESERIKSIK